ncbi:MAG: hypothetical protein ACLQE9_23295 [Roseiarcus sp.]
MGEAPEPKNAIPNFFHRNPLISPVSPKKSFGKIWNSKFLLTENKGFFGEDLAPSRAKARPPRVLQAAADGAADRRASWRTPTFD